MSKKKDEPGYTLIKDELICNSHHIIPRSRGGSENPSNKVIINTKLHKIYHRLFSNKTPTEIIDFLVNYFWGGKISIVEDYLEMKAKQENWEVETGYDR